jgi:PhnB protein
VVTTEEDPMTSRLNPYLTFAGSAREAMEFYQSVLGGNLTVNTFSQYGTEDPALADKVMHAMLETDKGYTIMASDLGPGMEHHPGNTNTMSLSGEDEDLREYYEKLSEGGTITTPLEKQMWGDEFGQFTDKYGVPWMVDIVAPQA